MLSSSASRFDSMPAQPPTPPKEVSKAVEDAISFLDDSHEIERALNTSLVQRRPSLQAAVPSPAPSQESAATTSKRVGFSPHTTYHQLPGLDRLSSSARVVKRSPARKNHQPLKSILKLTHAPPPTPDDLDSKLSYFSPDVPGSFANMLQSVLSQLASQSISNRLDAYMTINGALQAYSDVPDPAALAQKLTLLTQFLARDIAWKDSDGKLNTNIVLQALRLTNYLLFNDDVSAAFDADFRNFLVDRSITVIESSEVPKQIMKAHVHLLAQPKLHTGAMPASRADRILNAVQTVDQRCSGNNVISTRLAIYQRLLEKAPNLMLTRMRDWLEQTFHCMLSSISDIRGRAIDTCTKGGVRLGTQPHAAKALSDFLDTEIEEGQSYYEYFSTKIIEMLGDKEASSCVPRIWSALVLYFRNKRRPLEKWTRFRSWLVIIQKCLNSSDILVRYEATLAWNKLVYTTTFDTSLSPSMMKMLKTPIVSGIERRGQDAYSRQTRQYTMDCYHNLLHYGLRPSLSTEELATAWDTLVDPILTPMVRASPKGRATACRVLHGLLSGNGGVWNANAALMPTPIKSEDLPRLEPRWARLHLAKILRVMQPAVRFNLWSHAEFNLALDSAWAALMQTLLDAGAQEVKTSNDLKQAIALLVGFFRQLWSGRSQPPADGDPERWLSNYVSLINTMVTTVGPAHFTEDFLATSDSDMIEVAPTPSTKRSKHLSAPQSPMAIVLRPFFALGSDGINNAVKAQSVVSSLLDRFLSSRSSSVATLELLSRSYFALQSTTADSPNRLDEIYIWETFANSATSVLKSHDPAQQQQQQPGNLGQCLRLSVDVLSAGLATVSAVDVTSSVVPLYDAMHDVAKAGSGDGGIVIGVIEPVSKGLMTSGPSLSLRNRLQLAEHVVSKAVWPRNRQAMDAARKSLWGVGLAPHKAALFDPFDHIYALLVDVMTSMYVSFDDGAEQDLDEARRLFSTSVAFLENAPVSLLLTALRRTQDGFAVWVQDEARKTAMSEEASEQIMLTWTVLLRLLKGVPSSDGNVLKALETLLVAGFASPHKQVVNETILFWNAKFGDQESLEYPAKLESVLRARMVDASIDLPSFPDSNAEHIPATLPAFFETASQDVMTTTVQKDLVHPLPQNKDVTRGLQPAQSVYFTAKKSPTVMSTTVPSTIDRRSAASGSSTPKARLRHDDSQIQFAPIDSSPIRFEDDSQHLTEHQKEVMARQNVAAQMFPELSSSPMAHSTALPRPLPKRPDFSSDARSGQGEVDMGTPTAMHDATGLMSDDMPSSPTPSSTKDASQAALDMDVDDDQATEDELDGLSSSPPRSPEGEERRSDGSSKQKYEVGPDDTTVEATDFAFANDGEAAALPMPDAVGHQDTPVHENAVGEQEEAIDIPSDSYLPTEQLRLEEEAAETVSGAANAEVATDLGADTPQDQAADSAPHDVTRVEDSFVGQSEPNAADDEDAADSQGSRRSTRKRKRSSEVVYTAKKQKSASPFKRFISKIWPASQQDDDDMEDEIVVASSQQSNSLRSPPSQQIGPLSQPIGEPSADVTAFKQEIMAPPPKRGRGRPRKSATPTPSLSQSNDESSQARSLKRRASVLSNASAAETEASSSFVKDTPAPSKSRKGRKAQTASQASESASPQQGSQTGRVTRRTATHVMVSPPRPDDEVEALSVSDGDNEEEAAENVEVSTPQKETPTVDAVAAVEERPKLTPRSILGRLRDALSDFVGMKVSTSETREFDDVLFEFRREVFEAESRGRA